MKKGVLWLRYLFMLLAFAVSSAAFAQELTVTGKVTDAADGGSLPGVTIAVKNTTQGTVTDIDGKYSIKVQKGAVLVFSFVGYQPQEITVSDQTTINVNLGGVATSLSEVVVIGYGQVKKGDATGAVATVGRDDFNKGSVSSPQQLVIGKIPGVTVTTINGAPGGDAVIRIRGGSSINASNDPLVVIDGVPTSNTSTAGTRGTLAMINPDDIESYVVLKDASATAIYGSRASNGVIIITTKKGKPGDKKFLVDYSGNVSLYTIPKIVSVFDGDEFRASVNERYAGQQSVLDLLGTENTNWQDEIYRSAIATDHNLAFSGAYKTMPYRVSIGYMYQDGNLNTDNMQRTTVGLNLNPTFFKNYLKVSLNAKYMNINNRFADQGSIGGALAMDPTKPVYDENSPYGGYWTWTQPDGTPVNQATTNPVALLNLKRDFGNAQRFLGNIQADYKMHFFPDLRAVLNLGMDRSWSNGYIDVPVDASWLYLTQGQDDTYDQKKDDQVLDFYLNYTKNVESIKSKFDVMAGYSWQKFYYENNDYNSNVPQDPARMDTARVKREYYLVSFYGRFNYSLLDRYLLTFTLRDDGSSKFSEENRWGLFPSFALAWKINEEAFLRDSKVITQLKLRGGWGKTGQQDVGDNWYPYIPIYTLSNQYAQYQFGNLYYYMLRPDGYDENIKWEETATTNIGLDFGFLKDRITGSIEWYNRKTTDLLNYIPVPAGTNLSNYIWTNIGDMENTGVEVALEGKAISTKDWAWTIGANAAYNKNEITKLTAVDDPDYPGIFTGGISGGVGNTVQIQSVGYPMYSFYVYKQVYDENGDPIEGLYVDLNEDGAIDDEDRYHYKSGNPDWTYGLYTTLSYKRASLSMAGHGAVGNYVYNNVSSSRGIWSNLYRPEGPYLGNVTTDVEDVNFFSAQYLSDYYVKNGSYFKLDYITLAYDFGNVIKNTGRLRASFSINNVFMLTKYDGIDPELNTGTTVGIDNNIYPRTRVYVLGLNLSF